MGADLATLLGLSGIMGGSGGAQPLQDPTPDQVNALPPVQLTPAMYHMAGQGAPDPSAQGAGPAAPAAFNPPQDGLLGGAFGVGHPLGNFLGILGDALRAQHGLEPVYQPRLQQQRTQSALQNYLVDPQGAMANLMKVNAPEGISLVRANAQAKYDYAKSLPPELRDLSAMGIDPTSPQGQQILASHLGKAPNPVITEYEYYQRHGGQLGFGDFVRLVHPPAGGSLEESSAGPARGSSGALRLDPQSGQWIPE